MIVSAFVVHTATDVPHILESHNKRPQFCPKLAVQLSARTVNTNVPKFVFVWERNQSGQIIYRKSVIMSVQQTARGTQRLSLRARTERKRSKKQSQV